MTIALTHIPTHTQSYPDRFENEETSLGYSVLQDTSAEDPRSWIPDEHAALWACSEPRQGNSVAAEKPEGNIAIDAFSRFYDTFDAERSLAATRRWLKIYRPESSLQLAMQTIRGYSQSDWLDVVCAVENGYGKPEDHISEFRMWAYGDVWIVIPDGKPGISGIYADDAVAALAHFREHHEDPQPLVRDLTLNISAVDEAAADAIAHQVIDAIHSSDALPEGVTATLSTTQEPRA
jgi:hypothetical protein